MEAVASLTLGSLAIPENLYLIGLIERDRFLSAPKTRRLLELYVCEPTKRPEEQSLGLAARAWASDRPAATSCASREPLAFELPEE